MDEFHREGFAVLALGTLYDALVRSLIEISTEVRTPLTGFSTMSTQDVAKATGLPAGQAVKARMRLFDEPFVIPEGRESLEAEIRDAAVRRGLNVVGGGGGFWHLVGHRGKEKAVSILLKGFRKRYGEVVSIGLGETARMTFPFCNLWTPPCPCGKVIWSRPLRAVSTRKTASMRCSRT